MVSWIWLIFLNESSILPPFPDSLFSGVSPVEVLPQVEILPQYFPLMPQLITCQWSHSANKLISPYLEIVELFHCVFLQRMLNPICLRGFQGTVYRSAGCIYRYERSRRCWKKWETGKANCCGEKSCLLFFYKWIKLEGCCHPCRQTPCPFPCPLVWTMLQKPPSKEHLPPFFIWICWKVMPWCFSMPLRQALTAYLGMLLPTSSGEFPSCCMNLPLQILREPCFCLAWVQFFAGDLDGCGAKRHPGVLCIPAPFASRWQSVTSSEASLGTPEWSSRFSPLPSKLLAGFVWGFVPLWARFLLQNTVGFCGVFGNALGFFHPSLTLYVADLSLTLETAVCATWYLICLLLNSHHTPSYALENYCWSEK